jgi:hypothetical protein
MTEYVFNLSPIMEIAESLPYNVSEGIKRGIEWMQEKKEI